MRKWNKMREELEHNLAVLVELDLHTRVRAIRDGAFPNEEEMIKETVTSFEKGLPENLRQLPNCHDIIVKTLKKVEDNMKQIKQMQQGDNQPKGQER